MGLLDAPSLSLNQPRAPVGAPITNAMQDGEKEINILVISDSTGVDQTINPPKTDRRWPYLLAKKIGEKFPNYGVKYVPWTDGSGQVATTVSSGNTIDLVPSTITGDLAVGQIFNSGTANIPDGTTITNIGSVGGNTRLTLSNNITGTITGNSVFPYGTTLTFGVYYKSPVTIQTGTNNSSTKNLVLWNAARSGATVSFWTTRFILYYGQIAQTAARTASITAISSANKNNTYTTGNVSASGTTVTGINGAVFQPAMVGGTLTVGVNSYTITNFISSTQVTINTSASFTNQPYSITYTESITLTYTSANHPFSPGQSATISGFSSTRAGFNISEALITSTTTNTFTASVSKSTSNLQNGTYAGTATVNISMDLVIVSNGHNEGGQGYNVRQRHLTLLKYIKQYVPGVPIACMTQNPQNGLGTLATPVEEKNQLLRMEQIRQIANADGLGIIDATPAFFTNPNWRSELITEDGVHPTDAGSEVWAQQAIKHFPASYDTATSASAGPNPGPERVWIPANQFNVIGQSATIPTLTHVNGNVVWSLPPQIGNVITGLNVQTTSGSLTATLSDTTGLSPNTMYMISSSTISVSNNTFFCTGPTLSPTITLNASSGISSGTSAATIYPTSTISCSADWPGGWQAVRVFVLWATSATSTDNSIFWNGRLLTRQQTGTHMLDAGGTGQTLTMGAPSSFITSSSTAVGLNPRSSANTVSVTQFAGGTSGVNSLSGYTGRPMMFNIQRTATNGTTAETLTAPVYIVGMCIERAA